MKVQSLINKEEPENEEGYWYTAKDGRKVFVRQNETPLEAYNRMYPEDTRPKDDSGSPIDEEFDSEDNEELIKEAVEEAKKYKMTEDELRVKKTESTITTKFHSIKNNLNSYFTTRQLNKIKRDAFIHDIDYEKYLDKIIFKMALGIDVKSAIRLVFSDFYHD